ncbi:MAG: hypothetical protein QM733_17365 [Ilumatobacteraceae bacterium]
MNDLDRYLSGTNLLDCQGRVDHALTLLVDGRVRIEHGSRTIVVDPTTGHVEPPGAAVPDHVLHAAGELAGHPIPTRHHRHVHR